LQSRLVSIAVRYTYPIIGLTGLLKLVTVVEKFRLQAAEEGSVLKVEMDCD